MTPLPLHALIDDVAARLTSGRPSPGLRASVLAGIEEERTRRRRHRLTFAATGALAAAAVTAIAAVAARDVASFVLPTVGAEPTPAITSLAAGPLPVVRLVVPPAPRPSRATVETVPALSPEEAAWMRRAIPALPDRPPIDIASIQPNPLGTPLLELTPLATAPLAVAPIDRGGQVPPGRP